MDSGAESRSLLGLAKLVRSTVLRTLRHSCLPILRVRSTLGGPAMSESVGELRNQRSCDEISGIDAE